jgi:DNA-binding response OmpR family regulator
MNEAVRLLLVEDDDALRFIVKDNLEQHSYVVDVAENGQEALELFKTNAYQLIVLDVMLPRIDGFKVAEHIRNTNHEVPIIFLTARSMTEDKIRGLTIGGDDYISKPFSMEELLLKIKIFLKRSHVTAGANPSGAHSKKIGRFLFQPDELTLTMDGEVRKLTLKEMELIQYFSENTNRVLNRDEILEKVWGTNDYFLGRSLDVFISRLRKYFKPDPNIKITNLHGIGFRFTVKKTENLES